MKHAVIVAHPEPRSLSLSIAAVYAEAVARDGGVVFMRDLYRMGFDPCLKRGEIPHANGFHPEADVLAERAALTDADVFAFIYPLWFNAPPAMLKGYLDRVFGMGFGYGPVLGGGNVGLLTGRRLANITTSGAPRAWIRKEGSLDALKNLYDGHFASVCGLEPAAHLHFGGVTEGMRADAARSILTEVAQSVSRLFPNKAS